MINKIKIQQEHFVSKNECLALKITVCHGYNPLSYRLSTMESKIKIRKKFVPAGMNILYEDKDIVVIEKHSGLLSVDTTHENEKTALGLLTNYVRKGNAKAKLTLYAVHRLDRETSGLLIFAKSKEVREKFVEQWKDVEKIYLALASGIFKEKTGSFESYLAEDENFKVKSVKEPSEGKHAITQYKVIKESSRCSLLEVNLLTGRKNQIRVHLAEHGHPIIGDSKYGKKSKGRMGLHAWKITFLHPFSRKEMKFETEIPTIFKTFIESNQTKLTVNE